MCRAGVGLEGSQQVTVVGAVFSALGLDKVIRDSPTTMNYGIPWTMQDSFKFHCQNSCLLQVLRN